MVCQVASEVNSGGSKVWRCMDEFKEIIHCRSFLKFFSNRISFEMSFLLRSGCFSESVAES